jgi:hypothetical protein
MRKTKEIVAERLVGLEVRQKMREAARHHANLVSLIHAARRNGELSQLDHACDWLTQAGAHWSDEQYYGVTVIYACGVTLAYLPTGILDWSSSPKFTEPEQLELTYGTSEFSSASLTGPIC